MRVINVIILLLAVMLFYAKEDELNYKKLTTQEKRVIEDRGTEIPFTGKYNDHFEEGIYKCKRCGAPLYRSKDKFKSGCGWPSFDDEIPKAVKHQTDPDGIRTEIVCAQCGAHLGHVFMGEMYTLQNTRHCVNSISMIFEPAQNEAQAYVAGGCFWGVEYYMQQLAGVISAESGYMGGTTKDPDYYAVSSGVTGHAETVRITYDPARISFREIIKRFFEIHDPTQLNHQGPDYGSQYRSAIFYSNQEEKDIVLELIEILKNRGFDVVTQVKPAKDFYLAEKYHQDYYDKKGNIPYCHGPENRFGD